ncbi:MAG: hypothetical protein IJY04_00615 [Clostridia bacterium]|nr:hypothetical protein [Clostridia bacterium]
MDIEADGGINADNAGRVIASGVNIIVAGSAIFRTKKTRTVIQTIRSAEETNPFLG